ncbi:MAG: hypothetical protein AAF750_03890 [Planctomycetota bacterium]
MPTDTEFDPPLPRLPWRVLGGYLLGYLAVGLVVLLAGGIDRPAPPGDPLDYENIAWNLAFGGGFGHNWGDAEFREPYERLMREGSERERLGYGYMLNEGVLYDTPSGLEPGQPKPDWYATSAFRPPVVPGLMAASHWLTGRSFAAWRVLELVMVALAMTLAAGLAWRIGWLTGWHAGAGAGAGCGDGVDRAGLARVAGIWAMGGVMVAGLVDPAVWSYTGAFLTESAVFLGTIGFAWVLHLAWWRRSAKWVLLTGITMGALILTRSVYLLWLPFVMVMVLYVLWRRTRLGMGARVACTAGFVVLTLLVPSPWWVRNCQVLDAFMPLGTQGGLGISGGYSDYALNGYPDTPLGRSMYYQKGVWVYLEPIGFFDEVDAEVRDRAIRGEGSPIDMEKYRARYGQERALEWIKTNWARVPELMGWRLVRSWTGYQSWHAGLMLVFAAGVAGYAWWCRRTGLRGEAMDPEQRRAGWRRRSGLWLLGMFPVMMSLAVMATYSAGGRFMVPLLPVVYVIAAVALGRLVVLRRLPR